MTTNELALILMAEADEASDNTDFVTVVENWINDALDEFASAYDWRFTKQVNTFVTVASQHTYNLNDNVREIRAMRFIDTNEPIEYVDAQRLYGIAEDLENEGKPRFWFWQTMQTGLANPVYTIQMAPIPDAVYDIEMSVILHPTLDPLTSTELPMQREMVGAIKDRVRAYILESDKDYDGADRKLQSFYSKVQRMMEREKAPKAANMRMQVRDLSNASDRKLARLDPSHFS